LRFPHDEDHFIAGKMFFNTQVAGGFMLGYNKVILMGNLGKDPELRYTPTGQANVSFSLATTERWMDKNGQRQERTEWHNIIAWAKLAELANQYLKKGSPAFIEGKITYRSWDDKDGNKKYKTEVVANQIQFLSGGGAGGPQGGQGMQKEGFAAQEPASRNHVTEPLPQEQQSPGVEEELPF
jgi:single-strand DNA-binding protein